MVKEVVLCGNPKCCPKVKYNKETNEVIITDDDGDAISMTYEQFQILKKTEL